MPQRIQLSRKKGWKMPENTVKVDRSNKLFGNPYKVGEVCKTQLEAKIAFFNWTWRTAEGIAVASAAKRELRGKNLACWCKIGSPCHADVLLEIANQPERSAK